MLKTIPKSNISRRSFKVYKEWTTDQTEYALETTSNSLNKSLYKSLLVKYYRQDANVFNLYGTINNIANLNSERKIRDVYQVLSLNQNKYGEGIKPYSITFNDVDNDVTYYDDGHGLLTTDIPLYILVSLDLQNEELIIEDNDGQQFTLTIGTTNLNTGESVLTYGSNSDNIILATIDFEASTLTLDSIIEIPGLDIDRISYGNVFYHEGLLVFNDVGNPIGDYTLNYKSTQTIHETEILVSAKAGEFNYSQNPSAVEVTLSGSYDFETTSVFNGYAGGTVKIKEIQDIKRKESYSGSIGFVTGSWDDYYDSSSIDPTGSYLAPFISTIGIYDSDGDMVAVAKLPKPIKNLPDYDVNFIVRFDT